MKTQELTRDDTGTADRALDNAQALLHSLHREAIELPAKMAAAQAARDFEGAHKLRERREALPTAIHLATMNVLSANGEALRPRAQAACEARDAVKAQFDDIQAQIKQLKARGKILNDQYMSLQGTAHDLSRLMERTSTDLEAEEAYLSGAAFVSDPTVSIWGQVPGNIEDAFRLLLNQVGAIRTLLGAPSGNAQEKMDARLLAVERDARNVLRNARESAPSRDEETVLEHLREELALILQ